MRTIIALLLCVSPLQAYAEAPSDSAKDALIAEVLTEFYGPASDADPASRPLPIPTSVAYRAIEAGEISGEALRCNLLWIRHVNMISASARKLGMSETQVAFVNALQDAKLARTRLSMMYPCTDYDEFRARRMLDKSKRFGLEVATVSKVR
jgi:hypothetical protein